MRTVFRWTLRFFMGVVGLLLAVIGSTYGISELKLRGTYDVPTPTLRISGDAAAIERGRHLAVAIGKCVDCHGDDFGGRIMIDDAAVGLFAGPNLTSGGHGAALHDTDWVRAIRHGVRPDGTPLIVMPSQEYWHFDDEELAAVVAYIRSLPPVRREMPASSVGPVIRAMNLLGEVPMAAEMINHYAVRSAAPASGPTAEYGGHLVNLGCRGCHGEALTGGPIPGAPPDFLPAANITMHESGIGSWTEADFFRALRTGRRPDGGVLAQQSMPWNTTKLMTDNEIKAIWAYLKSVPAGLAGKR
jgi:mono/diheme cytochrome c family protein